jgi:predicted porin
MKKHLIAAAVAGALAVPAMAQVSIGGNFDISYDLGKRNEDTKVLNYGQMSTTALTIGGTEDLGNGLSAYFNVNSRFGQGGGIDGNVGSGQAGEANVGQRAGAINFGDRGYQVGVKGGFGDVAIGKTTSTAMGGIRGGVAGNFSLLQESTWGDRPNNMISYTTPKFGAVSARLVYSLEAESYEVSVTYAAGPLTASVAYADVNPFEDSDSQGSTDDREGNDTGVKVGYNFGPAAVNVSYIKGETGASYATDTQQYSVGVTVPLGAVSLIAEYGDRDSAGLSVGGTFYNVGAVYSLSKRTNVYGMYNDITDSSTATNDDPQMVIGIRHSF